MSVAATIRAASVLLLVASAVPAQAQDAAALARRAAEVRERLASIGEAEGEVLAAMESLEEMVALETAALAAAEKQVRDTEAALAIIESDLETTRAQLARRWTALEPRLVARYRLGRLGYLPILLSANSVHEFLSLRRMLARVVEADLEAMREVRRLNELLDQQRASLDRGRADLEALRAGAAARLSSVQAAREEREAVLRSIREDRSLEERALAEVERARRGLQRRMAAMARQPESERGFAGLRGRLPRPTPGAITTGFGARATASGGQKIHRGVDIRAPRGTPVRAVAPGRVVHADWLRGYGNLVIIDHGGGYYTLMAHLERLDVDGGAEVETGSVVGRVGDSGSFDGAHLYFEIRRGAEALDPEAWFAR
jgi:murein hydrolase activator